MTDEQRYYHVNGELVPVDRATVSVDDRGFRYGDAAFETLRAYGGTIFEWEAHADRLDRTCTILSLDHGLERVELLDRITETLAANALEDAYVRLSITRGVQPGTLTPEPTVEPSVVIYVKPLPRGGVDGKPVWDGPATVRTADRRRIPSESLPAEAKTHNYLAGILARQEWPEADDVLFRAIDGFVTEGTTSNLFFVRDGTIHTPSLDGPVLPGITRHVVLDQLLPTLERDWSIETGQYDIDAVRTADEAFLTNTTWELRPIERLDGIDLERGSVTDRLIDLFDEYVEDHCY